MKCIDAIEGTAKSIIIKLHDIFIEDKLDDTEHIRNVKAVIEGTDVFVQDNKEIVDDPQMLKKVLYSFSKALWLDYLGKIRKEEFDSDRQPADSEDLGYDEYYFDHIYNHNAYPR
ncbi:hypothetical protein ACFL9U_09240 [Thermodesulfobacteriota bacterium]